MFYRRSSHRVASPKELDHGDVKMKIRLEKLKSESLSCIQFYEQLHVERAAASRFDRSRELQEASKQNMQQVFSREQTQFPY